MRNERFETEISLPLVEAVTFAQRGRNWHLGPAIEQLNVLWRTLWDGRTAEIPNTRVCVAYSNAVTRHRPLAVWLRLRLQSRR